MSKKSTRTVCVSVLEAVDVQGIIRSQQSFRGRHILSITSKPSPDFATLSTSNNCKWKYNWMKSMKLRPSSSSQMQRLDRFNKKSRKKLPKQSLRLWHPGHSLSFMETGHHRRHNRRKLVTCKLYSICSQNKVSRNSAVNLVVTAVVLQEKRSRNN